MKRRTLKHEFVVFIPSKRKSGVVYVSIKYATAVHDCCCGCRNKVVTPISPTDWQLTFDGESISLYPSIGNWSFECRSHYWITKDKVRWASKMSTEDIERGKRTDELNKAAYYGKRQRF
jgi:hypothetical protein